MTSYIKQRQKAREVIIQSLYQWHMAGNNTQDIIHASLSNLQEKKIDTEYYCKVFQGVCKALTSIDCCFEPLLDRDKQALDPVELAILRMSTFELQQCLDVPHRVIINEALELAKKFGAQDSYKYINGILDKLAHKLRHGQINQKCKPIK